jgi:Ca2+-binding RTX toxin-like protein
VATINGDSGNNNLVGTVGADTINGGGGVDTMSGGNGNDFYIVDNAAAIVIENPNEGIDTVQSSVNYTLSANVENLILVGTANIGIGNSLNNTLDGSNGFDTLIGGAGDDTYIVANPFATIVENANEGTDTVQSSVSFTLGNNIENLVLTGGAINGTGNFQANRITGNSNNNTLDGYFGVDTLIGGLGNDTYVVNDANTVVIENANEGIDTVQSKVYAYTLGANVENLILVQSAGAGTGNDLNNSITGNVNNNMLDGGLGADTLTGGQGNDYYLVDNAGDLIIENASEGTDTVVSSVDYTLTANVEKLTLTGVASTGTGNALDNTIVGTSNDDTLDGGVGADTLTGGLSNDTYLVDTAADVVVEYDTEGIDTVQASVSYTLSDNVENLILTGTAISGTGNGQENSISGNELDNTLDGGTSADVMNGGLGNDLYIVDNGGDIVLENANEGIDTVQSSVDYTLGSDLENLTLTSTATYGTGNELDNSISGNSADNTLDGVAGADTLSGGAGNDTYIVDNAADVVIENAGEGTDSVQASVDYAITGDVESLVLTGSASNGTGNALDNSITGNSTDNILDGGAGADTLIGGLSNDTYIVDNVGDVVVENDLEGIDTVQSSIDYTLGDNVENLIQTGTAINGTGNGQENSITGNSNDNTLDGGASADTLSGGAGNDTYFVDNAGDVVVEGLNEGIDNVHAKIDYTLTANVENLTLTGAFQHGTGNDLNNKLVGDFSSTLDGGLGADTMTGTSGYDTFIIDNVGDVVIEQIYQPYVFMNTSAVQASIDYTLTANVQALILTGSASHGTGNAQDNSVTGNAPDNTLDGGVGVDTLSGGLGNDLYIVDNVADVVVENAAEGTDTVQSSSDYVLSANVENLILNGSAISGTGNASNNSISGNSGNNTLNGGAGIDTLIGGLGDDSYVVDNAADVIIENVGAGTDSVTTSVGYTLSTNVENLTLTGSGNFNLIGNALNNVILGNGDNNAINGGAGADSMSGGAGNDIYLVENSGDVVTEAANAGTDTVRSTIGYTLTANVENLLLTGAGNLNLIGNALNNVITGNGDNNAINGGAGADSMNGGAGDDVYLVDTSGDVVTEAANAGTDTVRSSINYTLTSNVENLILTGSGNNNLIGNALNNVITGNAGNNAINGGAGADSMSGGAGDDIYLVDTSGDVVTEAANAGTDTVRASISYTLAANVENLTLTGSTNITGKGNDLSNVLAGNSGNNTLIGGLGNDYYTLNRSTGVDTLIDSDSTVGNHDQLYFATDVTSDQLWFKHVGNDLQIDIIGTSNSAVIKNWYVGGTVNRIESMTAGDDYTLYDSNVENLVNAMAGMTEPGAGQTTLTPADASTLAPVFAANWRVVV